MDLWVRKGLDENLVAFSKFLVCSAHDTSPSDRLEPGLQAGHFDPGTNMVGPEGRSPASVLASCSVEWMQWSREETVTMR